MTFTKNVFYIKIYLLFAEMYIYFRDENPFKYEDDSQMKIDYTRGRFMQTTQDPEF